MSCGARRAWGRPPSHLGRGKRSASAWVGGGRLNVAAERVVWSGGGCGVGGGGEGGVALLWVG